eukprot:s2796_g18.t1
MDNPAPPARERFVPARSSGNGMPGWVAPRQPPMRAPRPSISAVAPALLGLLSDQQWQTRAGNSGAAVLGELLAEEGPSTRSSRA